MLARIKLQLYRLRFFSLLSEILSIRQPTRKETPWQNLITSSRNVRKNWPRKKKKEEKRQRKLENKVVETDETEKDPTPSMEDR
jgi:chromatin remodeling complex protein RSC6